ncbi:CotH kinase family protein [Marinoscillum sp.]|uniref:CotH kinase family protein n=1 Tax=Marinoscillum sp. TaxID=2024838 RepID=UPI003BA8B3CC
MKIRHTPFCSLLIVLSLVGISLISCNKDKDPSDDNEDSGDANFAIDIGDSQIPYIIIETSEAITNEPKVSAELALYANQQLIQSQHIGIEYRGSTSFRLSDKKSYGIETWDENGEDLDVSFFGWPEEEDWILTGQVVNLEENYQFDPTLMYHFLAYEISREMGRYASRCKFVEVELNGEYMGIYVFMEKLKRDGGRIDLAKLNPEEVSGEDLTGGYILKIDKTTGGDDNIGQPLEYFLNNWEDDARYTARNSFRSNYDIFGSVIDFEPYGEPYHANMYLETYFLYEYPDVDEIAPEQKTYIQTYVNDFEQALLSDDFSTDVRTYTNYMDPATFVDYFLINELCRNVDAYRLSTFLTKDKNGLLNMGPVWDMNIGFYTGDRIPLDDWVINYNNYVSGDAWMMPFWWPRLMEDPQFRAQVKARWQSLRGNVLSTNNLHLLVDQTSDYLIDNGAIKRNETVWSIGMDYNQSIQDLKNYLSERTSWMDGEISGF